MDTKIPTRALRPSAQDECEIETCETFQDIMEISSVIMQRYRLDHAVFLSMPTSDFATVFPILPMPEQLQRLTLQAVAEKRHPSAEMAGGRTAPLVRLEGLSSGPYTQKLRSALYGAGLELVYAVPLGAGVPYVFEVSRGGVGISDDELLDLQVVGRAIARKLALPNEDESDEFDYHVR